MYRTKSTAIYILFMMIVLYCFYDCYQWTQQKNNIIWSFPNLSARVIVRKVYLCKCGFNFGSNVTPSTHFVVAVVAGSATCLTNHLKMRFMTLILLVRLTSGWIESVIIELNWYSVNGRHICKWTAVQVNREESCIFWSLMRWSNMYADIKKGVFENYRFFLVSLLSKRSAYKLTFLSLNKRVMSSKTLLDLCE
jgi:hypothetical protein